MRHIRCISIFVMLLHLSVDLLSQDIIPDRFFYVQSALALDSDYGFWDLPGRNPSFDRGASLELYEKEPGNNWDRLYKFQLNESGFYNIIPANGGVLDVAGGIMDNGANIVVWESHGGENQEFMVEHCGSGRFRIHTKEGKIICPDGDWPENGSNVFIWDEHQGESAYWYLIERSTGRPYTPEEPVQPWGTVVDKNTGLPILGATVDVINTNDMNDEVHSTESYYEGRFAFEYHLTSVKYGYDMVISAPGYGSVTINSHSQYANGPHNVELTPSAGYLEIPFGRFGTWLYEKRQVIGENDGRWDMDTYYYSNIDGEVRSDDDFFFYDNSNRSSIVNALIDEMGLSRGPVQTDDEIHGELGKVWDFWCENSRSVGLSNLSPEDAQAVDDLYLPTPLERWPSVEEYARVYGDYGFIPSQNCTSHTLGFAALLSLTKIPPSRMAVEVMKMTENPQGEHWAVIIRLKGIWYWIDPQAQHLSLHTLDRFQSLPADVDYAAYDKPFKIITFPRAEELGVPLCGWRVQPERETGVYWDPHSPHLAYQNYSLMGTEPFWALRMDSRDRVFFSPGPGIPEMEFRIHSVEEKSWGLWVVAHHLERDYWMPQSSITFSIEERPGSDGMSDRVYPLTVSVSWDGETYMGVGRENEVK